MSAPEGSGDAKEAPMPEDQGDSGSRAYENYEDDFRSDFQSRYETQGGRF